MTDQPLACVGRDDLFFPEDDDYQTAQTALAKALCAVCPILVECQTKGLDNNEPFGIWGGLTPNDRYNMLEALYG